ncbi:MAG TPA: hypothetical protein VNT32_10390 [Thermoleophilaceae bacterium]|nr:hypothetical protein [Thermoleophilaceae bacterium]
MRSEDPEILGNLPKERPGRRSGKRPAGPERKSRPNLPLDAEEPPRDDPLAGAARLAEGAIRAGLGAAGGSARAAVRVLGRLRP